MVALSSPACMRAKKTKAVGIPVVDLSVDKSVVSELIVKACEEYGIFKVINHGIPWEVTSRLEAEGVRSFGKPPGVKQRAVPATPFGYELASEVLGLVAEGLWIPDKHVFSRQIRDVQSDSVLRFNHYPAVNNQDPSSKACKEDQIGFGEHSDPQILTVLRSNNVAGLEICLHDGFWIPVRPDPTQFYVIIRDALRVLTNDRFVSARHMALANLSRNSRMSMMYFGAPPLTGTISPLPQFVSPQKPRLYRAFTWGEYKKAAYSTRLGDFRLDLFKLRPSDDILDLLS
ncbi:putative DNA methyltransferase 1-associated protein [Hibiscus syriacus]|uniref:DNA methyltransferase 1-associated protein n=1 Tax=Hibiscus syriacus TaxID=106335 RepID=A0A6A3B029_HIBSY|nr:putative DNA methyltransferase 1-associated protein [Hibiscus syriacus]